MGHTQWKKGELPRFLIEYEDGSKQWHDVIEEAGTSVRLVEPDEAVTLVTVPVEIRNMLVHGTEIEITWVSPKSKRTEWHRGKIVAIDEERGIAMRYGKATEASVAGHTLETAHRVWKRRVEKTPRWEKKTEDMHQTKTEVMRTTWAKGAKSEMKVREEKGATKMKRRD